MVLPAKIPSASTDERPQPGANSRPFRPRYALLLALAAVLGELLKLPYSRALIRQLQSDSTAGQLHPAGLVVSVAFWFVFVYGVVYAALRAGQPIGLGWPPLDGWDDGAPNVQRLRAALLAAIASGALCSAAVLGIGKLSEHLLDGPGVDIQLPHWSATLFAAVGSGISEEIICRLGALTIFAWLGTSLLRRGSPNTVILWSANLTTALLFGALHLPQAAEQFGSLTGSVIAFALIGNGAVGLVFGWLYWRKGVLAAMVSHASTNIFLKVLLPLLWV
jgi:hypothetical protein